MKAKSQYLFTLAVLLSSITISFSQTGPAGVGSSTNNVFWLKADAGTSSTTDGATISSWNDQSGNGINVSQSTVAQRPTFKASLMNGLPAVEFDNNNTAGQNDYLLAPDDPRLDNTAGYSIFSVVRMKNLDGNLARTIVSKRTAIDTDEAFMFFFFTNNYSYLDIDGIGDRFSTNPITYSNNMNYIMDAVYDGSLTGSNRSKIYEGEILRKRSTETSALVPDKTSPLNVGISHSTDLRPFAGFISEIIIYRTALNKPSRIIVNNYLSAKYNIPLTINDKYDGDNTANGDYDRDVAGIGNDSLGSTTNFATSIAAGLRIAAVSGLDAGDYLLAGHAFPTNSIITTDVGGMTGTSNGRWQRIWYYDVTNTSTPISADIDFNSVDGGVAGSVLTLPTDYVLLYRPNQTGNWTELATASTALGNIVSFNNITLTNDGYYTLGLKNTMSSLPVTFINFSGHYVNGKTNLSWQTATETDNDYFIVQKSRDAVKFDSITKVPGAGSSKTIQQYTAVDNHTSHGITYYRLKQVDLDDRKEGYSSVIAINSNENYGNLVILPNPINSNSPMFIQVPSDANEELFVELTDINGRELFKKTLKTSVNDQLIEIDESEQLQSGIYFITVNTPDKTYKEKLVIK